MSKVRQLLALAALVLLAAVPSANLAQTAPSSTFDVSALGSGQRFADGRDWANASADEKQAFMFGIANAISVAIGWDERHVAPEQVTFSRRARDGLAGTTLGEAVSRIDAWYAANPGRLATPVVAVIWLDIAKPKLQGRK
jgi:hypothetical protein